MKIISIELIRIHPKFKVKFSVMVEAESMFNKQQINTAVNKYVSPDGNTYITIKPVSYINIDIANKLDKKDYSSNYNFSLNRRDLLKFIIRLERIYRVFTEEKELFFYDSKNNLCVNREISNRYIDNIKLNNGKVIRIEISNVIVKDEYNNKEEVYEGVYLSINSMNYYTYLTYDQIALLLITLKNFDFTSTEILLINTYTLFMKEEAKEIEKKEPISEVKDEEIIDTKNRIFIEDPHEISDIIEMEDDEKEENKEK